MSTQNNTGVSKPVVKETMKLCKTNSRKAPKVRLPKDRIGIRKPFHFINLPNGDVRHSYPKLFSTSINSLDPTTFKKFLSLYTAPECDLIYHYDGEVNPDGPIYSKIEGTDKVQLFFESVFLKFPDYFMTVWNTSAQANPTTKCGFIKSTFKVTYTKFYEGAVIKNFYRDLRSGQSSSQQFHEATLGSCISENNTTCTTISSPATPAATDSNDDKINPLDREDLLCGELFDMLFNDELQTGNLAAGLSSAAAPEEKSHSTMRAVELYDGVEGFTDQDKLVKPCTVVADGTFVMHLDSDSKITKFIYFYKMQECDQLLGE